MSSTTRLREKGNFSVGAALLAASAILAVGAFTNLGGGVRQLLEGRTTARPHTPSLTGHTPSLTGHTPSLTGHSLAMAGKLGNTAAKLADIPIVRLQKGLSDADNVRALREGFEHYGLVFVDGHGIEPQLLDALYTRAIDDLFNPNALVVPAELDGADIWRQRGLLPRGTEKAQGAGGIGDEKWDFFASSTAPQTVRRDPALQQMFPEIFADNRWPRDARAFRRAHTALGLQLSKTAKGLAVIAEQALEIPTTSLLHRMNRGPHVERTLRYAPQTAAQIAQAAARGEALAPWGAKHTDLNAITIIPGGRFYRELSTAPCARPEGCGLFLFTRDGERIAAVPPEPGLAIAQVGMQLEALSGARFKATPHEITSAGVPDVSRVSSVHFNDFNMHERLRPVEGLSQVGASDVLDEFGGQQVWELMTRTLERIGLAPEGAVDATRTRIAQIRPTWLAD